MTTFDTESELHKVANEYPGIKLVLRVRCDDPEVRPFLALFLQPVHIMLFHITEASH
jgi:hypothetical protein